MTLIPERSVESKWTLSLTGSINVTPKNINFMKYNQRTLEVYHKLIINCLDFKTNL